MQYKKTADQHDELFRLHISKSKAMVLPKRFFNSKEEINSFKEIVKQNLDANKEKLKK